MFYFIKLSALNKNIVGLFIIKALSLLLSIILVPVMLNALNAEKYGIWIALNSMISWFSLMDIGFGNGFRNKLTEAVAIKDFDSARELVESIYTVGLIILIIQIAITLFVVPFFNWHQFFNLSQSFDEDINLIIIFISISFAFHFFLKNINLILDSLQKPALSNFLILASEILIFLILYGFNLYYKIGLLSVCIIYMIIPIVFFILVSNHLFNRNLKNIRPRGFILHKTILKGISVLGIKFFILQLASIILFSSSNFIIIKLFSPVEVTTYNLSFRFFAILISLFSIVISPFWAKFTHEYSTGNYSVIKLLLRKLNIIWLIFCFLIIIQIFLTPYIYKIWLNNSIQIPFSFTISFALYSILISWCSIYSQFLNGIGKVNTQLFVSIIQCLLFVPLSIILSRTYEWGINGVIYSSIFCILISAFVLPINVFKIISKF